MRTIQHFSNKEYTKNGRIVINCLTATLQWINDIAINFIAFRIGANHIRRLPICVYAVANAIEFNPNVRLVLFACFRHSTDISHSHLTYTAFGLWFDVQILSMCDIAFRINTQSVAHSITFYCKLINFTLCHRLNTIRFPLNWIPFVSFKTSIWT